MSEVAGICHAIFHGTVWLARTVWQLMKSIFNFNYCLVTSIIQIVSKTYRALNVLCTSVVDTFCEVLCYLGQGIAISITWPWHLCTFIFQIMCSASSVVTESSVCFFRELCHISAVFYSWITGSVSFQHLLDSLLSSCLFGWNNCISTAAQFLQSLWLIIDFVLVAITKAVWSVIKSLIAPFWKSCCEFKLVLTIANSLSSLWDYATPGALLCYLVTLLTVLVLLWHFRYRIRSESLEVVIRDFDDIEVSDDERNLSEITLDDNDVLVLDDEEDDTSVETLVTDQSESDEDEDLPDYQGSEAGYLSSTDSNRDSDTDNDSDESDVITIQLPERSTLNCSVNMGARIDNAANSSPSVGENEQSLCVICQDQVKSVLVLPCRHLCMCVDCAHTIVSGVAGRRRICPLCRSSIRTIMNIYT